MERDSFERFYYQKVALSEGCGCAERIIDTRELDAWWQKTSELRKRRMGWRLFFAQVTRNLLQTSRESEKIS